MTEMSIGVDISKAHLDACRLPDEQHRRFCNDRQGRRAWIQWIVANQARVVFEPTGAYHAAFEQALMQAKVEAFRINPFQARSFARFIGQRAKTDRIDARMLARIGQQPELPERPTRTATMGELAELAVLRRAWIKQRVADHNRLERCDLPLLRRQIQERLKLATRHLAAIEAAVAERVERDPALVRKRQILESIPGFGRVTADALLIELPELGTIEAKKVSSLAGLAPVTQESGKFKGRARIQGGRRNVGRLLYMAALSAIRHNPDLVIFATRLRQAGKPTKLVLVAVMRKLVELANTLVRQDREWRENPA